MTSRLGMCWKTMLENAKSNSQRRRQRTARSVPLFWKTCALGLPGQRLAGLPDHLAADVHRVDLAEQVRQGARDPSGAAADLEHLHLRRGRCPGRCWSCR